jgi:hypothetical protein
MAGEMLIEKDKLSAPNHHPIVSRNVMAILLFSETRTSCLNNHGPSRMFLAEDTEKTKVLFIRNPSFRNP